MTTPWVVDDIHDSTMRAATERLLADWGKPLSDWFPVRDPAALARLLRLKGYLPKADEPPEPFDDDRFTIELALKRLGRVRRNLIFGDPDVEIGLAAVVILDYLRLCGINLTRRERRNEPGPHGMVVLPSAKTAAGKPLPQGPNDAK